ncbi:MAG: glycosyltransferase [Endomicrobium sp.]|jgi:glycosyltransferase involved in cell wall biosynthesis|nr:glycosyltransferase [Endomicrobium sp.]
MLNIPKVSVIIPIYNVEKYIRQCLESVISQTLKDIEILCIDDCSTDTSIKIVESFLKKDNRIKILQLNNNKLPGIARNIGIQNSIGTYISFIDPDDYVKPDFLEVAYTKLEELQLNSVWFNIKIFDDTKKSFTKDNYFLKSDNGPLIVTSKNINIFPINCWNKVYRLSTIKENNIIFSENILFEDLEFYYRFFTQSKEIYFINKHLYIYRLRPNSILSSKKNRNDIFKAIKNIYNYLNKKNIFEDYKESFIQLIIQSIERSPNIKDMVPYIVDLLKQINFPKDYTRTDKNNFYDFLNYIIYFNKLSKTMQTLNKYYFGLIFGISKFLPKKSYRKKCREKFKKYIF